MKMEKGFVIEVKNCQIIVLARDKVSVYGYIGTLIMCILYNFNVNSHHFLKTIEFNNF